MHFLPFAKRHQTDSMVSIIHTPFQYFNSQNTGQTLKPFD